MPILSWFAVYFVTWWICLFVVLPIGAHSQHDAGEVVAGSEPGAPVVLRMWPKLLATSVLAGVVLVLIMWGVNSPWLQQYVAVNRQ